jgi:hypothetical protein
MLFALASNDTKEVGTHTVTVVGFVADYTNLNATTTFTVTVDDPCLDTILSVPTGIADMKTSVLVQSTPGSAPLYIT